MKKMDTSVEMVTTSLLDDRARDRRRDGAGRIAGGVIKRNFPLQKFFFYS